MWAWQEPTSQCLTARRPSAAFSRAHQCLHSHIKNLSDGTWGFRLCYAEQRSDWSRHSFSNWLIIVTGGVSFAVLCQSFQLSAWNFLLLQIPPIFHLPFPQDNWSIKAINTCMFPILVHASEGRDETPSQISLLVFLLYQTLSFLPVSIELSGEKHLG